MDQIQTTEKLDLKKGLWILAVCWVLTALAVAGLRQVLIPRDELNCYARVGAIQKAVNGWNKAHPDRAVTEEIDEAVLVKEGLLPLQSYDREKHYYFVGETAHGPRVKCNKHEDNPLVLRLTGDTLLAVLVFIVFCSFRGYVLFDPE